MRIPCNCAIVCGLGAAFVGTVAGCRLGESLDGYTSGRQQDTIDAQQEAAPGSGGSAGTVGTGGTAQGGEAGTGGNTAGAGGGTTPQCEASDGRCVDGVYQTCVDGKWEQKENCANTNQYCSAQKGCVDKCDSDDQCKDHEDKGNGEYCRDDGRCSPKLFETVWDIPNADKTLILPYFDDKGKGKCNFRILWGDEAEGADITKVEAIKDCKDAKSRTHTYSKAGKYHVKILGTYNGWGTDFATLHHDTTLQRLSKVVSFGPVRLTQYAFSTVGDIDLPNKDIPDASNWTNARGLFFKAEKFNKFLNHWDVSNVEDMSFMFGYTEAFNQPLDKWDVSNVKDMSSMFKDAEKFDNDINGWDVSKVTNMSEMFMDAKVFNQPLDKWDVSNVENMALMFKGAEKFNSDINGWDVSKVKNMTEMFMDAKAFNLPLDKWIVSSVENMAHMFKGAEKFNSDINGWGVHVKQVKDMKEMFMSAKTFNQPLDKWIVSDVKNMESMLSGAEKFDQDLSAWTLNKNVMLNDIFWASGMSRYNYCKLKGLPVWKEQFSKLGLSGTHTCS